MGDEFKSGGGPMNAAKDQATIINNYFAAQQESIPSSSQQKIFFGVPNLPPNHLPRPEYIDKFRAALQKESIGLTGAAHLGVEGMGGIGKSVLAAALAHDEAVQAAFPDGIFWLTFGQKVEDDALLVQQNNILKLLGHKEQEKSLDLSRHKLNSVLHSKRCLFIIDDIWDSRHLKCFDLSGTACRFLLTSRKADVLDRLGMERKRIDLLSEEQALAMLARHSGCALIDLPKESKEIVKECGYLPLAVAAIGSMVRNKPEDRWQLALRKLKDAKLNKIACKFDYQYEDVFLALQVSVEMLPKAFQEYYKTLVVFSEDAEIPESVVVMYWEYFAFSDDAPQDVLDALLDASLIASVEKEASYLDDNFFRLHDLLRDYLISQTEDIAALHKQLLEAYKAKYPGGWHTIPCEEPYYFHNYWHVHAKAAGDMALAAVIADTLIRQQPMLSLQNIKTVLKFVDYKFADIAPHLLKTNNEFDVNYECFKILGEKAKYEAKNRLEETCSPHIAIECMKCLGDDVKEVAEYLLKKSSFGQVINMCLKLFGDEAKEDVRQLIKKRSESEVILEYLHFLQDEAKEDAKRLLKENSDAGVIHKCLIILGKDAKEDAKLLLKGNSDAGVINECLIILGEEAKEDSKWLLKKYFHLLEQKDDSRSSYLYSDIINKCLSILGEEAREDAKMLLKKYRHLLEQDDNSPISYHYEDIISTCLSILGDDAKEAQHGC